MVIHKSEDYKTIAVKYYLTIVILIKINIVLFLNFLNTLTFFYLFIYLYQKLL
jgi:hypothetical protein